MSEPKAVAIYFKGICRGFLSVCHQKRSPRVLVIVGTPWVWLHRLVCHGNHLRRKTAEQNHHHAEGYGNNTDHQPWQSGSDKQQIQGQKIRQRSNKTEAEVCSISLSENLQQGSQQMGTTIVHEDTLRRVSSKLQQMGETTGIYDAHATSVDQQPPQNTEHPQEDGWQLDQRNQDRNKPKPTATNRSSKEWHNKRNKAFARTLSKMDQSVAPGVSVEIEEPQNIEQPEASFKIRRNTQSAERTQSEDVNMHD